MALLTEAGNGSFYFCSINARDDNKISHSAVLDDVLFSSLKGKKNKKKKRKMML